MNSSQPTTEIRLKGLALSGGRTVARACLFREQRHNKLPQYKVSGTGVAREIKRLEQALAATAERLETIRKQVEKSMGKAEAEIFVAQRMIVTEGKLRDDISERILKRGFNAEMAVTQIFDRHEMQLAAVENEYLRARAGDIGEIKRRILDVLADTRPSLECELEEHCQRGRHRIVVAEELTPSLTVDLDTEHLMGFLTEHGGINSHAAILARALGIPAVSGLKDIRSRVRCGTELLIDGDSGEVIIWPSEETLLTLHATHKEKMRLPAAVEPVAELEVLANIGTVSEISQVLAMKAEGIGLYRTEMELIAAGRILDEDELAEHYSTAVRSMEGRKVIIRLFDIGSDKPLPSMEIPKEDNPALGHRGARFLLARTDLLRMQARALARASLLHPIHVMYPMITGLGQFMELKDLFTKAVADLPSGEIIHGVMLEVPSACFQASEILAQADFASIGTNDLTQYFFAVDRNNELVAADFNPDQPVFWNLLKSVVEAARRRGKHLSLCGELAGDPKNVPRLIAIGVKSVSVSPRAISAVRQTARAYLERSSSQNKEGPINLAGKKCLPCKGDVPPLKGAELAALIAQLDNEWNILDGRHLEKKFAFRNFREALDFANLAGDVAETEQHHPEITVAWGKVTIRIWTHKINGLTENDFILAAKINESLNRTA